jgi:hypothetical protein
MVIETNQNLKIYAFYGKSDCNDSQNARYPELLHTGHITELNNVALIFVNIESHYIYDKFNIVNLFSNIKDNYDLLYNNIIDGGNYLNTISQISTNLF